MYCLFIRNLYPALRIYRLLRPLPLRLSPKVHDPLSKVLLPLPAARSACSSVPGAIFIIARENPFSNSRFNNGFKYFPSARRSSAIAAVSFRSSAVKSLSSYPSAGSPLDICRIKYKLCLAACRNKPEMFVSLTLPIQNNAHTPCFFPVFLSLRASAGS